MKKITTTISIIIVILGLLFGTGIFLITKFINPNDFKAKITEVVYQKTGRELKADGSVAWSFFPWLGVKVNNLALNNTPKFKGEEFAKIDSCDVKLKILPLIFGKVIIDKVVLNNFTLKLIKNHEGDDNWRDLLESLKKSETSSGAIPFLISDISINNANISIQDQQNNQSASLTNLTLLGKNINASGTPFFVSLKSNFKTSNPDISGNYDFSGNININFRKQLYAIDDLEFKGNILTPQLIQSVPFSLNAKIIADAQNQILNVNDLKITFSSLYSTGSVKVTNIFYAPNVIGTLAASSFDPKPLLQAFGILQKNINPASPVFRNATFKIALQTTSKFLKIPTLNASIDDTILTGQANYSHFGDKLIALNLDVNKIDLDSYLSLLMQPEENNEQATQTTVTLDKTKKQKSKKNDHKLVETSVNPIISGLRLVKIDGDLHIENLTFKKMNFSNVNSEISGDLGLIQLNPVSFNWYGGKVNGYFNVNVRKSESQISANANVQNASIQPLFIDLINDNKVGGILSLETTLNTKGNSSSTMLNNLNGKGNIKLNKGTFYGIDVRYQVDKANALINKKIQTMKETNPPKTDFGQMTSSFAITNGAVLTNNLLIQGDDFKVKGYGTVDLPKQMLNFLLEAYGKKTKFYVPIKLTGPILNPSIAPDLSLFIGNIIENKVTNELGKDSVKIETEAKGAEGTKIKSIKIDKNKLNDFLHNI